MELLARRAASLQVQEAALRAEFEDWRKRTEKQEKLEKHNTQVRRITAQLEAFLDGLPREAAPSFAGLEKSYTRVLGAHRIWAFFRSKLALRDVAWLLDDLTTADELAWACYQPVREKAKAAGQIKPEALKEPPLLFFSSQPAPFVQGRETNFQPEGVTSDDTSKFGRAVLKLPVPVIGLPWFHVDHLPIAALVAHEVGHAVERDFGLEDQLGSLFDNLSVDAQRRSAWKMWRKEIFADVFGIVCTGRASVLALMDYLINDPMKIQQQRADGPAWGLYPPDFLRMLLNVEVLSQLAPTGCGREAWLDAYSRPIEEAWRGAYLFHQMTAFEPEIAAVVGAILTAKWEGLGGATLAEAVPPVNEERVGKLADDILKRKALPTNEPFRQLFAAATVAYHQDTAGYVASNQTVSVAARLFQLIPAGVRSGDRQLSQAEQQKQQQADRQAGAALLAFFDEEV
ncbi:MAG: hypothetical protein HY328_13495 [Chloroflexi bacterium]|nr:hypothetical protein [Chloroflexota bacterium]